MAGGESKAVIRDTHLHFQCTYVDLAAFSKRTSTCGGKMTRNQEGGEL